jgi:hypothetical protein
VAAQLPHSKLLNEAAREILGPLGVAQMGRSRTWVDDRGWWLGVVNFQPSSFGRGSYLNVGVHWLVEQRGLPHDSLSFDFGFRVDVPGAGSFIEFESEEQFAPLARSMAVTAAEEVCRYRALFPTAEATAEVLRQANLNLLQSLDAAIILGLAGDTKGARALFGRYITYHESGAEREWRTDWDNQRYERARALSTLLDDESRFRDRVKDEVRAARKRLKLEPDVDLPF